MFAFLKKHWPLFGIVAAMAVLGVYLVQSHVPALRGVLLREIFSGRGLKMSNVRYAHDDPQAEVRWVLDAKEVRISGDQDRISFEDFLLTVKPKGRPWIKLTGRQGRYSKEEGEIHPEGNLEGRTENGYRFVTERILLQEHERQLRSDEPVQIFGPFFSVAGRGLFVDLEAETVRILSDVTTILKERSIS